MIFEQLDTNNKNEIAKDIEYNVAQEAMARDYYYSLLTKVSDEHKNIIKGIIDDEINHSIILMKLAEIYTGNKPSEFQSLLSIKRKEEVI